MNGTHFDAGLSVRPTTSTATPSKLKKSLSNAEDRRRKSLLPWHRKNRSKSKDRGESEYDKSEIVVDIGNQTGKSFGSNSSKSSLTSMELGSAHQVNFIKNFFLFNDFIQIVLLFSRKF